MIGNYYENSWNNGGSWSRVSLNDGSVATNQCSIHCTGSEFIVDFSKAVDIAKIVVVTRYVTTPQEYPKQMSFWRYKGSVTDTVRINAEYVADRPEFEKFAVMTNMPNKSMDHMLLIE